MPIANYSPVRLLTDRFRDKGLETGAIGYVIEVYPNGDYEVEFSEPASGITIAQVVAKEGELEALPASAG
jgi:hypothetical protein